ncbi:unnamed protein product [Polarella glacialis]|uniref:Uncharacterized protein n=1 Tax=Polarella glacialis TaxID=89957 RepID=A0A813GKG0_POLGL|nr:unnamed protein product [Polarella glacialis]CAE8683423.1 unnamed protein product [Polarella glacialis]
MQKPFKRTLCRHHQLSKCVAGSACSFAHGTEDLQKHEPSKPQPEERRLKTQICDNDKKGYCFHGEACWFAHGKEQLRNFRTDIRVTAEDHPRGHRAALPEGTEPSNVPVQPALSEHRQEQPGAAAGGDQIQHSLDLPPLQPARQPAGEPTVQSPAQTASRPPSSSGTAPRVWAAPAQERVKAQDTHHPSLQKLPGPVREAMPGSTAANTQPSPAAKSGASAHSAKSSSKVQCPVTPSPAQLGSHTSVSQGTQPHSPKKTAAPKADAAKGLANPERLLPVKCLSPDPELILSCTALIPKWNAGDLFTVGPTHLLRKAIAGAAPLLHYIVKAHFEFHGKGSKLKFKITDYKDRFLIKDSKEKCYQVSRMECKKEELAEFELHTADDFAKCQRREVWDVGRLLDHIYKQQFFYNVSKKGSETGVERARCIRNNLHHRPYLNHARSTNPERVHKEVFKDLNVFLKRMFNIASEDVLARLKDTDAIVMIKKHREVFERFKFSSERMKRMSQINSDELDLEQSLKCWEKQIEREELEEATGDAGHRAAGIALLSIIGSRFEQEEKLPEVGVKPEPEDDFTEVCRASAFKLSQDVRIPVLDRRDGKLRFMLNDPLAVKNQDLVHTGFDALSLILWDILNSFGQPNNFQHEAFSCLGAVKFENGQYTLTVNKLGDEESPRNAFKLVNDPSMLLQVVQELIKKPPADDREMTDLQLDVYDARCEKLIRFNQALGHHILDDEDEWLTSQGAAVALKDMRSVACLAEELCSFTSGKPELKQLLKLLHDQVDNKQKGKGSSAFGKFTTRERLPRMKGKALRYMQDRLLPSLGSLNEVERKILAAQLARVPKKYLMLHDGDSTCATRGTYMDDESVVSDLEEDRDTTRDMPETPVSLAEEDVPGSAAVTKNPQDNLKTRDADVLQTCEHVAAMSAAEVVSTTGKEAVHQPVLETAMESQESTTTLSSSHSTTSSCRTWNFHQVASWLDEKGWEEYSSNFTEQEIDGDALLGLTMAELEKNLGVKKLGPRKNIYKAIQTLVSQAGHGS